MSILKIMKNGKVLIFTILVVVAALFLVRIKYFVPMQSQNTVIFPKENSKLLKGQTYTLLWTPGSGRTDIFLVDRSLESVGVSVSIADRVYNIENSGQYQYTVPKNIPDGEYKFNIGPLSSPYFEIKTNTP